ncbi:50S ribosomal protein L29 [Alloprevotella tannerae]|uniref:50S ribosomal protein L29 n=1 Tax=Alloprevotella tannerae TaxID=76122 RepID=UPI0028D38090|nr:50S ribosomal protein L29 [Alloprevotella tannerae]
MNIKEIRQIPQSELQERLASEVDKYGQLILTHSVSPLENSSQIKEARRTIARLKTFIRENELNNSK